MRHLIVALFVAGLSLSGAKAAEPEYFDRTAASTISPTGCNASDNVQIPGTTNLFIGRQLQKSDGSLVTPDEQCGSDEGIREAGRSNRWGLVLSQLDWGNKKFSIIKPLIISDRTIPRGPFSGAILRVAEPQIVVYRGQYLLTFECFLVNGQKYGSVGASACIAPYDPERQEVRLDRVQVVVSGQRTGSIFHSASVPQLLVFKDNLYLYWATLTVDQGKFMADAVRGVQLEADGSGFYWAKGVGHMVYSIARPTVEVWGPDADNPMSNTAVDIKSVWAHGNEVIMLVSLGGGGCADPGGRQPGCFRTAIAKASQPLGPNIFNRSPLLHEAELPTNPQDYAVPIRNPSGGYSILGTFRKPVHNDFSELRPIPADWSKLRPYEIVIFPFTDRSLWPTQ